MHEYAAEGRHGESKDAQSETSSSEQAISQSMALFDEHTLQQTDTLQRIAVQYGIRPGDIMVANSMMSVNELHARKAVRVPRPGVDPRIVRVKPKNRDREHARECLNPFSASTTPAIEALRQWYATGTEFELNGKEIGGTIDGHVSWHRRSASSPFDFPLTNGQLHAHKRSAHAHTSGPAGETRDARDGTLLRKAHSAISISDAQPQADGTAVVHRDVDARRPDNQAEQAHASANHASSSTGAQKKRNAHHAASKRASRALKQPLNGKAQTKLQSAGRDTAAECSMELESFLTSKRGSVPVAAQTDKKAT